MSENEFLGRHNKTAYYITNLMHLQKSSPRREKKMDLAFRELNAATEKYPIRCPQKHILTDIWRDFWCTQEDTIVCALVQKMSVETMCIHLTELKTSLYSLNLINSTIVKEILVSPRDLSTYVSVKTDQTLGGHVWSERVMLYRQSKGRR